MFTNHCTVHTHGTHYNSQCNPDDTYQLNGRMQIAVQHGESKVYLPARIVEIENRIQ